MTVHLAQNMLNMLRGKPARGPFAVVCGLDDSDEGNPAVLAWRFNNIEEGIISGLDENETPNDAWKLVDCPLCILAMDAEEK